MTTGNSADEDEQEREWAQLYGELRGLLARSGKENSRWEGDFWVVGDNWGTRQHKVCVTRISWLTPSLVEDIRALLRGRFPEWEVLLSIDPTGIDIGIPPSGLIVRADRTQEVWDRDRLRRQFGADFKF